MDFTCLSPNGREWCQGICLSEADFPKAHLLLIPLWQVSVCQEMVTELQSIILCKDSFQPRRRRGGIIRTRPIIPEERRARTTTTLSNGKLCGGGDPEQLAQRLAQEAALVARGCTHIRVCPECRRFQGLRVRPGPDSPVQSDESLEWEKVTNSSEPE